RRWPWASHPLLNRSWLKHMNKAKCCSSVAHRLGSRPLAPKPCPCRQQRNLGKCWRTTKKVKWDLLRSSPANGKLFHQQNNQVNGYELAYLHTDKFHRQENDNGADRLVPHQLPGGTCWGKCAYFLQ